MMGKKEIITEGKAKFYASIADDNKISKELDVFYNPVMKFNRDISVLFLNSIEHKDMQFCDIMAGSGVRSIRFLLELNDDIIKNIHVNDYSEKFLELFDENIALNKDINSKKKKIITTTNRDANKILLDSAGFDYIDIDPFGSPNDFLDSSIKRLSRNGILAVTATDTAPLSGTYHNACLRKYWAKPLRNHLMHEIGLRILIRKIQLIGSQYDKALIPVLSYFKDHYFRIFFLCTKGKRAVDETLAQHKYFLYCNSCTDFKISKYNNEKCEDCSNIMEYAGPLWTKQLCEQNIIGDMINNINNQNIKNENSKNHEDNKNENKKNGSVNNVNLSNADSKFLQILFEESQIDFLGFYDVHAIAKKYKIKIPRFEELISRIKKGKSPASRTVFSLTGIKADISLKEFLKYMKETAK